MMVRVLNVILGVAIFVSGGLALQHSSKDSGEFDYVTQKFLPNNKMKQKAVKTHSGARDLAFMHVPFNFGHTIEKVALFPESVGLASATNYLGSLGLAGGRRAS